MINNDNIITNIWYNSIIIKTIYYTRGYDHIIVTPKDPMLRFITLYS